MTNKTRDEYNRIARQYEDAKGRLSASYSIYTTFASVVGRIDGLEGIDLACGGGYTSRILVEQGAKRVVGIDISEGQIELAEEHEARLRQGIEYHVADASKPEIVRFGKFDLVTAAFLLNYSPSKRMLNDFMANITSLTKPNGRVVGLVPNSDAGMDFESLCIRLSSLGSKKEGSPYRVEFLDEDGNVFCEFTNHFWLKDTYEQAFRNSGFNFKWHNPIISKEGMEKFGEEFWKEYLKNRTWLAFEAKK